MGRTHDARIPRLHRRRSRAGSRPYGYIVVFLLVMCESIGLPVPGETALIAAALYAGSTGHPLEIEKVIIVAAAAAIIGDNIGFAIGRYGGAKVLVKYGHKVRLHEDRLRIGIWPFRHHGGKVVSGVGSSRSCGRMPRSSPARTGCPGAAFPLLQYDRRGSSGRSLFGVATTSSATCSSWFGTAFDIGLAALGHRRRCRASWYWVRKRGEHAMQAKADAGDPRTGRRGAR